MPLQHSPDPAEPSWVQGVTADFLIFYSSRDESGKLWCPVRPHPCLCVVNIRPDRKDPDFLASPSSSVRARIASLSKMWSNRRSAQPMVRQP